MFSSDYYTIQNKYQHQSPVYAEKNVSMRQTKQLFIQWSSTIRRFSHQARLSGQCFSKNHIEWSHHMLEELYQLYFRGSALLSKMEISSGVHHFSQFKGVDFAIYKIFQSMVILLIVQMGASNEYITTPQKNRGKVTKGSILT